MPVDGRLYIYVKVHMVDSQVRTSVHQQGHIVALARQCHPHPPHLCPELSSVVQDRFEGLVSRSAQAGSRLTSTRGRMLRTVPSFVMLTILHASTGNGPGPGISGHLAAQDGSGITANRAESDIIPAAFARTNTSQVLLRHPSPSHYTTVPSQNAPLCAPSGKVRRDSTTL